MCGIFSEINNQICSFKMKFDSYRYEVWCPFVQKAYHCSVEAEMWIKCKVNVALWKQAMPLQLTQQVVSATVKWHYHLFPSSASGNWAEKAFLISWERISEQESLEGLCLAEADAQGKGRKPSCTTKALGWSLRSLRLSRWLLREPLVECTCPGVPDCCWWPGHSANTARNTSGGGGRGGVCREQMVLKGQQKLAGPPAAWGSQDMLDRAGKSLWWQGTRGKNASNS